MPNHSSHHTLDPKIQACSVQPTMSETQVDCESCGQRLPSIQAICPACAAQFERELQTSAEGAHLCPVCTRGFDQPIFECWPRGAKWYTPRQMKPTCPHCREFLLDRKNPPLPAKLVWILAAVSVVTYLAIPSKYEKPFLAAMLAIYASSSWLYRGSKVNDRERYGRVGG